MKKSYNKPVVEKIEFDYSIVTQGSGCGIVNNYTNVEDGSGPCTAIYTGAGGNPTQAS